MSACRPGSTLRQPLRWWSVDPATGAKSRVDLTGMTLEILWHDLPFTFQAVIEPPGSPADILISATEAETAKARRGGRATLRLRVVDTAGVALVFPDIGFQFL